MNQRVRELLHLPDIHTLQAGAAALLAVLAINPEQVDTGQYRAIPTVAPKVSSPTDMRSLAATGVTYEPAAVAPAPAENETPDDQEMPPSMPDAIERFIENNTVRLGLGQLSCSGSLIRNQEGEPIGALTAAHCLTSADARMANPLLRGGDGNRYMVPSGQITLGRGENTAGLEPVGDIESFVLPAPTSNVDAAFVVRAGYTPRQILKAYRRRALTPSEARELIPNEDTIWLAGYPQIQKGDGAGNAIRQEFGTGYVGKDISLDLGSWQNILSATVNKNANGALCSWGISGGEGLVVRPGSRSSGRPAVYSVGPISSFAPFYPIWQEGEDASTVLIHPRTLARQNRFDARQTFPEANLKAADALCNYGYMPMRKYVVVYPVTDKSLIPGPVKSLR